MIPNKTRTSSQYSGLEVYCHGDHRPFLPIDAGGRQENDRRLNCKIRLFKHGPLLCVNLVICAFARGPGLRINYILVEA